MSSKKELTRRCIRYEFHRKKSVSFYLDDLKMVIPMLAIVNVA